jgi:hypothetical protein
VEVIARIKRGISIPQVQAAMKVTARQIEREDPEQEAGLRIAVSPWREPQWKAVPPPRIASTHRS